MVTRPHNPPPPVNKSAAPEILTNKDVREMLPKVQFSGPYPPAPPAPSSIPVEPRSSATHDVDRYQEVDIITQWLDYRLKYVDDSDGPYIADHVLEYFMDKAGGDRRRREILRMMYRRLHDYTVDSWWLRLKCRLTRWLKRTAPASENAQVERWQRGEIPRLVFSEDRPDV